MEQLISILKRIDGKGYKAYKDIKGRYQFPQFQLTIDHVQGDPFAAPSRISVQIKPANAAFPESLWDKPQRRVALQDYLTRAVQRGIKEMGNKRRGSGKSGAIDIVNCGQQVLERNSVLIDNQLLEARLTVGLPASGRSILGRQAIAMLCEDLPQVINKGLFYRELDANDIKRHVDSVEDQHFLRCWLAENNAVAFVADGAVLPRRSGIDDRPLQQAVAIESPQSLRRQVSLPNAGNISGMIIPQGVTLIVGGGFHGKSTLLKALETGIYNHIPGDGREQVVTHPTAVKIRAEDGRKISDVNISPFITDLPFGRDTNHFSTENASGSTSQAANIVEALDHGCRVLLIDEDTSATNFMIRDRRMQALVSDDKEPITPLLFRVKELFEKHHISSVIVMGGSGDYFAVSDTVIMMDHYRASEVTKRAHELADSQLRPAKSKAPFNLAHQRKPPAHLLDASRGRRDVKIDVKEIHFLLYGEHQCDLSKVEQIAHIAQSRAIGLMIYYYAQKYANKTNNLQQGLQALAADMERHGLDLISPYKVGNLALPRLQEVAAAINRLRERPR